jgi:PPE-repeat protein
MSTFGDAAAAPPEINHTLMIAGDLGESLVQAAAGYESVADMLIAELTAMGLNTSTTAMVAWQGPGGVMMEMSAAEFMAVCAAASAWIRVGQIQAAEVAAAHTAAVETMIPAAVCVTNRTTQGGLILTNWFGQNTPAIIGLEAQYQMFWVTNATARTGYGSVVSTALGALSEPPPLAPTASDPLGPAAGVAQAAAQDGTQSGLQASAKTMTQAADAPASAPSTAQGLMTSMAGQAGSLFGEFGSAFGQITSAGQQLPSMLGQAPQMMSGLLGPLGSMQGLGGGSAAALAPEAAVPASLGGVGALAGGGGGGGGLMSGSSALSTTFVRPANSFSSPNTPTLPGGWQGGPEAAESQSRPAGMGGGGLYGAPPGMGGTAGAAATERSGRPMQVTARSGAGRGERQRI